MATPVAPVACSSIQPMGDEHKVPTNRWGRLARLARAGANTGIALVRSKAAEASVERAAHLLGELRGVATKMGQMASYIDGLVPDEQQVTFERAMSRLRASAPQSTPAQIRAVVERQLNAPVDRVFTEWSDTPIASASIGQVHLARLPDGRQVAVKVQHEGITEAMKADLSNTGMIDKAVQAFGMGRFEVGRLMQEASDRFREELDYRLEAERLQQFTALHASNPKIRFPELIPEASSDQVLTTSFLDGMAFEDAVQADPELRAQWCATLWTFVYGSIMLGGLFNADPHPGNYRFYSDGSVGFLDFGCVQKLERYHQRIVVVAHQAANRGDFEAFEEPMSRLLQAQPGQHRQQMADYMRFAIQPITHSPFRLTRDYASSVVGKFKSMVGVMRKMDSGDFKALPPGLLFLNRLQFGFYSVLARLDAEVDYAAAERTFLPQAWEIVRDYEIL